MSTIDACEDYSRSMIAQFSEALREFDFKSAGLETLSTYVCGSFGRLEAHAGSDFDPFFVDTWQASGSSATGSSVTKLELIKYWAHFIEAMERLGFKPLTSDGIYLEAHDLEQMQKIMGGREDDYRNHFTARMLLLLESRPLAQSECYENLIEKVVGFYYRDYHDHVKDFRPVFFLNDILRYWKTMCLNYEHNRNLRTDEQLPEKERQLRRAPVHLKNLKLKFSRLLICYSMVAPLAIRKQYAESDIISLVKMRPLERIDSLRDDISEPKVIDRIFEQYDHFLGEVSKFDIKELLADRTYRNTQFSRAYEFSKLFYELLDVNGDKDILRYILV